MADYVERVIAGDGREGELIPLDDVPVTLLPILRVALTEHLPVLNTTNEQFRAWARTADPHAEVPRGVGMSKFTTGGRDGEIASRTFSLLRLQDALDTYQIMMPSDKRRADAFLKAVDGEALKAMRIEPRLTRRNYKLALV